MASTSRSVSLSYFAVMPAGNPASVVQVFSTNGASTVSRPAYTIQEPSVSLQQTNATSAWRISGDLERQNSIPVLAASNILSSSIKLSVSLSLNGIQKRILSSV